MNDKLSSEEKLDNFDWIDRRNLGILAFTAGMCCFTVVTPVFMYYTPAHRCNLNNNSTSSDNGNYSFTQTNNTIYLCQGPLYFYNTSEPNETTSNNQYSSTCTTGLIYDMTYGPTSVSDFNLVCENSWKRPIMQAMFMTGVLFGSLIGGPLSDRFGRKPILQVSVIVHACMNLILSFSPTYSFFLALIFLTGMVYILVYITTYVYAPEMVSVKHTSIALLYILTGWGIGFSFVPLVAYFAKNWVWLPRTTSIVSVFVILLISFFLPESPHWLKQNKIKTTQTVQSNLENSWDHHKQAEEVLVQQKDKLGSSSPLLLLKIPVFRTRIIVLCILWNVGYLGYFTSTLNSSNLGGDMYVSCLISSSTDVIAGIFIFLFWNKLKRRTVTFLSLSLSAFSFIATPFCRNYHVIAGVVSAMLGKLFITGFINIVTFYTMELFPTLLRNTSVGITSMSARVASILSPFLIFAGESVDHSIPFYAMGGFCLACCFLIPLLPETANIPLPDSNQDALNLEKQRTSCFVLKRRKRTDSEYI